MSAGEEETRIKILSKLVHLCFLHSRIFLQPMYLINDLNILLGQFLRPNKVCDCDSLLVHRVEVLDVVVKEVIRAVANIL